MGGIFEGAAEASFMARLAWAPCVLVVAVSCGGSDYSPFFGGEGGANGSAGDKSDNSGGSQMSARRFVEHRRRFVGWSGRQRHERLGGTTGNGGNNGSGGMTGAGGKGGSANAGGASGAGRIERRRGRIERNARQRRCGCGRNGHSAMRAQPAAHRTRIAPTRATARKQHAQPNAGRAHRSQRSARTTRSRHRSAGAMV